MKDINNKTALGTVFDNSDTNSLKELIEIITGDSAQMIYLSNLHTFRMFYVNKLAQNLFDCSNTAYTDMPCYKYFMDFDKPCSFCPLCGKDEKICTENKIKLNGNAFSLKCRIIPWKGEKAILSCANEITETKRSKKIFKAQLLTLMNSIPDSSVVLHIDVTDDTYISYCENRRNINKFPYSDSIDTIITKMVRFIPSKTERDDTIKTFSRNSLKEAYKNGNIQLEKNIHLTFGKGILNNIKITARLMINPSNGHLECVLYSKDISNEMSQKHRYEVYMKEQLNIFNALGKDYLNIFLINAQTGKAKILKLDGYVTAGLDKTKDISYPYYDTCRQYVNDRVHPDDKESMLNAMKLSKVIDVLSKKSEYVGTYKILVDNNIHYYRYKYIHLDDMNHIIAAFQCIDEIIENEKIQQNKLAKALVAAEAASRAKTNFLNNISHDIRTPLNAIIGFTALAKLHLNDKDAVEKYLSKITVLGNHLLLLINDVLDMSHIESGKTEIKTAPMQLKQFWESIKTITQPDIESKNLKFIFDIKSIKHNNIIADKVKLNQIIINILSNAIKYTPCGGIIHMFVYEESCAEKGFAKYKIKISDNGIGMSEEFQKHIYEAFSREHTSTNTGIQGTGLGMAIAKKLIDMMGGKIELKSRLNKGSEFTIYMTFKISSSAPSDADNADATTLFSNKTPSNVKHILLAEDNMLNQEIAVEILKEAGFEIDTANDGISAVEKIKSSPAGTYDIVLMDIQMPNMDGYEATKQIRNLSNNKINNIPIFALTANAFESDKQKALDCGMNGFISKPIDIPKLIKTINDVVL